jgi:splicing factor 1
MQSLTDSLTQTSRYLTNRTSFLALIATMSYSRISRWSSPTELTPIFDQDGTPLPTEIQARMTQEQLEIYVLHLRTLEITNILRPLDSLLVEKGEAKRPRRAASPDPEYDAAGRRTNTRPQRRRQALEAERHDCIEGILAKLPAYRAPSDYRRPRRFSDRLFIPNTSFPSINFIGQILGPRGRSLKDLQERCGATIVLRGRGSVKEGRGNIRRPGTKDFEDHSGQPLHAVICADSKYKVQVGMRLVQDVVNNAISSPEEQNERKREQLRDLAIINGTFRDDEARQPIDVAPASSGNAETRIGQLTDSTNDKWEEEYGMLMEDIRRA